MNGLKKTILFCLAVSIVGAAFFAVAYLVYPSVDNENVAANGGSAPDRSKGAINVLLLGTDKEASLCDVIMLANIDCDKNCVTIAQIPRDTYANYTDNSYKKLNGAYNSLGGAKETASFLEGALGIKIDHYICVGLDTVRAMVDAVGGVDINIPFDMKYCDPEQDLYIDIKKGANHLDGALAEQFLRFRSAYLQGDIGRIDAQKIFVAAFLEKISSCFSPAVAVKLAGAAEGIETDMSVADIMSLGVQALDMKGDSINILTLAGSEVTATQSGASYYVLSRPSCEEIMQKYFGGAEFDKEKILLNKGYTTFKKAYFDRVEYTVLPIEKIKEEGLQIQIK